MKRALWIVVAVALLGYLGYQVWWQAKDVEAAKSAGKPSDGAAGAPSQVISATTRRQPVSGVVLGPDERPLAGARVSLCQMVADWPRPQLEQLETLTTGPRGGFTFRTSRGPDLVVEVTAKGCGRLLVEASEQSPRLTLRLAHGFRIRGRVLLPDNRPVPGCEVFLEPSAWSQMRAVRAQTDLNGWFLFEGVPAEVLRVTARHPDYRPVSLSSVTGGMGDELTLQFEDEEGLVLRGRITKVGDADSPVEDAEVRVYPGVLNGGLFVPQTARTNSQGQYQITGIGPGNYSIEVRHQDHSTVARRLGLRESREVNFELMGRATLRGRCTPSAGLKLPASGLPLQLVDMYGSVARTDGGFVFAGSFTLGPATLELAQSPLCFKSSHSRRLHFRLEEEGEVSLELELSKASVLRGVVRDEKGRPVRGVVVSTLALRRGAAAVRTTNVLAVTNQRGQYEIRGLPPGSIELRYQHDQYAYHERSVEVESQAAVEIEPVVLTRPATVRGRVTRGGRGVAGAAVFVGRGFKRIAQHITGADGRYVLRGLPAGVHSVKARFSTLPLATRDDVQLQPGQSVDDVDLVLARGRRITGEVVDQDDEPLGDIQVIGPQGVRTHTDGAGKFALEVPLGRVRLRLRSPQDAELGARMVGPRQQQLVLRVSRAPRGTLKARVLGLPGVKPQVGAIVELFNTEADNPFTAILSAQRLALRSRTAGVRWLEMPGGRLLADNVPAGSYLLTIYCRGHEPYRHPGLLELPARVVKDLGEIRLQPGATMRGRVVDPKDRPIADARVLLGEEAHLYLRHARNHYHTDGEGLFEVAGVGPDNLQLVVAAQGYAPATIKIRIPQDLLAREPRTIRLERGATVQAHVVDRQGESQRFRLVVLARRLTEVARGRTDERGVVQFTNLQAGLYRLHIRGDLRSTKAVNVKDTSGKRVYETWLKPGRRRRGR
jgi:hypothetical protein